MLQPVLIKDLLQSGNKNRNNSINTSVSTQKKKAYSQRLTQPYLNTQSCYKPKQEEGEESSFLSGKSFGGNKVRRQLYQNLDSPNKSTTQSKENTSKFIKPKKKTTRDSEEPTTKSNQNSCKSRKSLLLPPNSIKNNYVKKTESDFKFASNQNRKSSIASVNKIVKDNSRITATGDKKNNVKKNTCVVADKEKEKVELDDVSRSEERSIEKSNFITTCDKSTMTSPSKGEVHPNIIPFNSDELERPSVIMRPLKMKSSQCLYDTERPHMELKNLNIHEASWKNNENEKFDQVMVYEIPKISNSDHTNMKQIKSLLECSLQACENEALRLRKALDIVNSMINGKATHSDQDPRTNEKFDESNTLIINSQNNSSVTDIVDQSIMKENVTDNLMTSIAKTDEMILQEESKMEVDENSLVPIKIVVTKDGSTQESNEISSSELSNEMARLSTIGEVSYENDESNKDEKDDLENKENVFNPTKNIIVPGTPKTPRTPGRRSVTTGIDSQNRRRSARLSAKRLSLSSLSESDKNDSFSVLENKLNVMHNKALPSKSLPASPMKPPMTPGIIKQWDKKVERPLREYMALKVNGSFLVTPDVQRFQSRLEPTDTPHSRKSLSRKIFMELCDLYADSPESK